MRSRSVAGVFACAVAASFVLALPAVSAAGEGITIPASTETSLQLKGSGGYTIRIFGNRNLMTGQGAVTISANRGKILVLRAKAGRATSFGAVASYTADGTATGTNLKARFGKFGKVSIRFHRIGKPKKTPPERNCTGGKTTTLNGVWKGRIKFRGEHGYTKVNATSARGSVVKAPKQTCHPSKSPTIHSTDLDASRGSVFFFADRRKSSSKATFDASVNSSSGAVSIFRTVVATAPASKFAFDLGTDTATVKPPAPFQGQASLGASNAWTGSLTVSFPGRKNVPLAGAGFFASLASS